MAILLAIGACGASGKPAATPASAAPPIADLPVTRWVPAQPTFVLAAPKLRAAQDAVRTAFDALGPLTSADAASVSRALTGLLAVDPLGADAAAAIGVDLDGGFAAFSDDVDPTFVVHLSAPDALAKFFDTQRGRGLVTRSVVVDGVEVFSAKLGFGFDIGWAIDHDWLWVHLALPGGARGTDWFEHSHHPAARAWAADWAWAEHAADRAASLLGFVRVRDLVDKLAARAKGGLQCAELVRPIARLGVSMLADPAHAGARLSIDLGDAAARALASHVLAPPPGWAAASAEAAIAVQDNVDLDAIVQWLAPCAAFANTDLGQLRALGVRAGRGMLLALDPDGPSGQGAVALDLASTKFVADQLDQIPMRKRLESDRRFGAHAGHRLAIPFVATVDYVLEDHLALAAMGDGVLDRVTAAPATPPPPPPLASLDIAPPKLARGTWQWLLERAGVPRAKWVADQLGRWRDGHIALALDGTSLVVEAAGHLR